jgi:hypothetical protein
MNTYGGAEVELHADLITALNRGDSSVPCSVYLFPRKEHPVYRTKRVEKESFVSLPLFQNTAA